jgi:hypothetical protein|tara:strand:- start:9300 stop:9689 length:390 start_codon:yes stop_codon:yes gene_type:complete
MAFEIPGFTFTRVAGADLSSSQYYFVKLSTTDTVVVCAAATDIPIGILQNAPTSGQEATIMVTGISKVSADAALAIGQLIGTAADGQADAKTVGTDTTQYVVGNVLVAAGAAGEMATTTVNCLNPHRAA